MRRSSALIAIAAAFSTLSLTAAFAQSQVQVGVLECRGGPTVGLVVGSVNTLACTLRAADVKKEQGA